MHARTSREAVRSAELREGPSLPDATWRRVVAKHWDKTPFVIKAPFGSALPQAKDVFPAVITACDAARRGALGVRLYLERKKASTGIEFATLAPLLHDDLPSRDDASPRAYARRVAREHAPDRFCLLVNELQRFDWGLLLQMRPFLRELARHGMVPPGGASLNLLLGDYRRTPFGVHKDPFHVFTFVVEGSKHVLLWPFEAFADHPTVQAGGGPHRDKTAHVILRPDELSKAAAKAIVLDAKRGDLIYWPPSYWHVVVGTGALAMTLSWDLQSVPRLQDLLDPAPLVEAASGWRRIATNRVSPRGHSRLPRLLETVLAAGGRPDVVTSARLTAAGGWLRFQTGLGCTNAPEPDAFDEIQEGDVVRGLSASPIAWTRTGSGDCVFSANGHSLELATDAGTLDLVCDVFGVLNRLRPVLVGELTARFTGRRRISRDTMRTILTVLGSWHALERVLPA